jgi:hypothetical protein
MTPARYYRRLNELIQYEATLSYDPVSVNCV